MRRRKVISCFCVLLTILFTGCYGRGELDLEAFFPLTLSNVECDVYESVFTGIIRSREVDAPSDSDIEAARRLIREEETSHITA